VEVTRGPNGRAAPRGVFLRKREEDGEGMSVVTANRLERGLPVVASMMAWRRR
jgi:hypothetical protein